MVLVLGPAGVAVCIYLYPDDYPVWFQGYSVSEGDLASMTPLWAPTVSHSCSTVGFSFNILQPNVVAKKYHPGLYMLPGNISLLSVLVELQQFHC